MNALPLAAQIILTAVAGALAGTVLYFVGRGLYVAGLWAWALACAPWRLRQPHTGVYIPGAPIRPPLRDPRFYGSLSLADERSWWQRHPEMVRRVQDAIDHPSEGTSDWESWRETMERELAPEALDHDERCISCGADIDHYLGCPDDPNPDYEGEAVLRRVLGEEVMPPGDVAPAERLVNVPRPGREVTAGVDRLHAGAWTPEDRAGPGHPVADLLAAMSDEEFWYAAKFELRALAWMASEPFKLPAWPPRAVAA